MFLKQGFKFIEYDTGPCTADKIVLQADKYGSSLAECVSSDFEMDKGLAKYFKKSFKHKELLKEKGKCGIQLILIVAEHACTL